MKTTFSNNEIVHVWASQKQPHGRANSMSFDGATIYSYSEPIGQFVDIPNGTQVVLLNRRQFSVTTSAHQSRVFQAVNHKTRIEVGFISTRGKFCADNQDWYTEHIQDFLKKASRAKRNRDQLMSRAHQVANDMRQYCEAFNLDWTVPEIPDNLESIRVQAKAESKLESEAKRQREVEAKDHAIYLRDSWLNGNRSIPASSWMSWGRFFPDTELRVIDSMVETSQGARFPVSHARLGLKLVDTVVASGAVWVSNGHVCHLGHYEINRIEANGTVHAGCHVVTLAAINRIREQLERGEQK